MTSERSCEIDDGSMADKPHWLKWSKQRDSNQLIRLTIPYPSGLHLSQHVDENGIFRVGRVGYSAISIRDKWNAIHSVKNILSISECSEIIQLAEQHASRHGGWLRSRHANYPTTGIIYNKFFGFIN